MEFRVLGPIEVCDGQRRVDIGGGRAKAVLACLLLHADTTVPRSRLIEMCWDTVPDSVESNLRTYLSRLRKRLTPDGEAASRLVSDQNGHRLVVRDGELDLARFTALTTEADTMAVTGDVDAAASGYEAATRLWRGEVFHGATVEAGLAAARAELVEHRDQARIKGLRARIDAGGHAEALAPLRALVVADPTHQELVGLLMLALYRGGRQDEALAVYRDTRRRLIDELGVEPGAELAALQARILDGTEDVKPAGARRPATVVPAQLPAAVLGFTGRRTELAEVTARAADRLTGARAPTAVIVDGMGGVGKTALAVHAGHRLSSRFPDGQLFVDLHGYTESVTPVEPADALRRMLLCLGVAQDDVPPGLDDRAALYRTVLASRRVLVLLDNCADAAQLAPLLPGDGESFVIATSRRRLTEMDSADIVSLGVMDRAQAAELFRAAAGGLADETGSAELIDDLVGRCGGLPLAIRLAAGRLRGRRGWTLRLLGERLSEADRILEELSLGERNVAAALALSCNDLSPEAARSFELLGGHPSAEFDGYMTAALTDVPVSRAVELLEHLSDANLLIDAERAGRYRMHDLVRAYASRRGAERRSDAAGERRAALARLLTWYRDVATRARGQLTSPVSPPPDDAAVRPGPGVDDPESARRWFATEYESLMDCVAAAVAHGFDRQAVDLTLACWTYANRYDRYLEQIRMFELAAPAARRLDDGPSTASLLMRLGTARQFVGQARQGLSDLEQAAAMYRDHGDAVGEVETLSTIVMAQHTLGRYAETVAAARRSIALSEQVGDVFSKCVAIINAATSYRCLARHAEGTALLNEALDLARESGNEMLRAYTLINLGQLRLDLDDPEAALACQLEAAAYFAARGEPSRHAEAKFGQMAALRRSHETAAARALVGEVTALIEASDDPELTANAQLEIGLTELAAGDHRAALDRLEQARTAARRLPPQLVHCRIETGFAATATALGDVEQARTHGERARDLSDRLGIAATVLARP